MSELPGMLALAQAMKEGKWPHIMDAQVWAREFIERVKKNPDIATDEGAMIAWFSNAIMAGWDTAKMQEKK